MARQATREPRAPRDTGNYISEWFGRRIYPVVRLCDARKLTGVNKNVCPFLSEVLSIRTECWKSDSSKGVCTISSASNRVGEPARRVRQDWLVCPHRVIHTDLVKESCALIFGDVATHRHPAPVSALRDVEKLNAFKAVVQEHGQGFLFIQDKLGGEISLSGTVKSPSMKFDVTLVEILRGDDGGCDIGRYGIMELQTMDFHGNYRGAVDALRGALDLHRNEFPQTLQNNLSWASRGVESPNIANVFKRTFYQMLIKFKLASGRAAAGTVLALPKSVWDSWQPFLGGPTIEATNAGYSVIQGAPATTLNAFICVFDIDAATASGDEGQTGVAGQQDISSVRIEAFIKVDPETLAHHAFNEVPREILSNIAGTDLIMGSIRERLAQCWPELVI